MTVEFRQAVRSNVPLLIGLAGGTGSGKTLSALLLAQGLAGGRPFYGIDTENGRMLHYADQFDFQHGTLESPFEPVKYAVAIDAAINAAPKDPRPVVVVDSFSHEYAGEGGLLDWHDTELTRMAGDDWKKREAMTFAAWVKPKAAHKRLVQHLLQVGAHLIICLRAEEKIELVRNSDGKIEVKPKRTLSGHVGWIPVAEKSFAYELTLSMVLTPDAPGVPVPIKLQAQHRPFFPEGKPITAEAGVALAAWAGGESGAAGARTPRSDGPAAPDLTEDEEAVAQAAAVYVVTIEPADAWVNGLTLAQVHAEGERGVAFFKWALGLTAGRGKNQDADLEAACRAYTRAHLPAVHDEATVTA